MNSNTIDELKKSNIDHNSAIINRRVTSRNFNNSINMFSIDKKRVLITIKVFKIVQIEIFNLFINRVITIKTMFTIINNDKITTITINSITINSIIINSITINSITINLVTIKINKITQINFQTFSNRSFYQRRHNVCKSRLIKQTSTNTIWIVHHHNYLIMLNIFNVLWKFWNKQK